MISKRDFLAAVLAAVLAASLLCPATFPAAAQNFPTKPIKIVVPFPPGGPIDSIGRLIGQHMTTSLGQNVIIENRPGAGGTVGANAVATAAPDGHTLLMGSTTTLSISPFLYKNIGYDPVKGLVPVSTVSIGAMVLVVSPSVPAKTVRELVIHAKTNPGKLNFGAGTATPPHLAGELFKAKTGTNIVFVPYRGAAPALTDLLSDQIQMMIDAIGTLQPHIDAGKVRALAVTSVERNPALPNLPTMIEAGVPGYTLDFWTAVVAPAGTPPDVVAKLNGAINNGLKSPELAAGLSKFNLRANIRSPQDAERFMAGESRKWREIIKSAGVKVD
jgi:tripartite-type tricarboxylate transporter receptor subunit TctC